MRTTWTAWAVMLATALATVPAWAEGTSEKAVPSEETPRTGWNVEVLPNINFVPEGAWLGLGARVRLEDAGDGSQRPYRYSVTARFFHLLPKGGSWYSLMLDAPGFLSSSWWLGVKLRMNNDDSSPYFGVGEASRIDPCTKNKDAPKECQNYVPRFKQRTIPGVELNARHSVWGPLRMELGYHIHFVKVNSRYAAGPEWVSRLEEDARAGLITGLDVATAESRFRTAEVTARLLLDTRDNKRAPVRGMFHELGVRAAHEATGSSFDYWGATANLRFYHPVLHEHLVAALRLIVDVMDGEVPFVLLSSFGGVDWQGIGGSFSARGIRRNRLQGKVKALANGELRWRFLSVSPLQQRLNFTLVAFLDAGNAWADLRFQDAGIFRYSAGGGLRIGWEKHFTLRLDCGVDPQDGIARFYLESNHLF